MATEIVMPQLNLSMDSGRIAHWSKHNGDQVNPGDILLEVETDKATVEVEAVEPGILQIILAAGSLDIPVGTVIAYLHADNETGIPKPASSPTAIKIEPTEMIAQGPASKAPAALIETIPSRRRLPSSPAARRKAAELKIDWQQAKGTGRAGRIKERDVLHLNMELEQASALLQKAPHTTGEMAQAIQLTPLARRFADDFGLNDVLLAKLIPGKNKIEREDVENALRQIVNAHQAVPQPAPAKPASQPQREPMGAVRRRIAERMTLSQQSYAPVTLTTEVDATELVNMRAALKNDAPASLTPSYNVLFTKITARALKEHPALNASLNGSEILTWPEVNIGLAVNTERGLVVPVVRDIGSKPLDELTIAMNDLLSRAALGKATPDELTGGTFTITNLGAHDIDAFTPIINPPECAVLGVGRLRKQMVVVNDQPAVRTMLVLSLTFDHRQVDGAPAARFLQRIKQLIEQPYLWLT
jgi:pyruvate dehydrogenase E2 component (dihydrolipoamide acetyltransferase)